MIVALELEPEPEPVSCVEPLQSVEPEQRPAALSVEPEQSVEREPERPAAPSVELEPERPVEPRVELAQARRAEQSGRLRRSSCLTSASSKIESKSNSMLTVPGSASRCAPRLEMSLALERYASAETGSTRPIH